MDRSTKIVWGFKMNYVLAKYTVTSQKWSFETKKVLRTLNFYVLDTGFMIQDPKGNKRIADVFIEYGKVISFELKGAKIGDHATGYEVLFEIAYVDHNGWKQTLLFEMRESSGFLINNQRACREMKALIESRGIPSLFMKGVTPPQNQTLQNYPVANPMNPVWPTAQAPKPAYKRWWFWVILFVCAVVIAQLNSLWEDEQSSSSSGTFSAVMQSENKESTSSALPSSSVSSAAMPSRECSCKSASLKTIQTHFYETESTPRPAFYTTHSTWHCGQRKGNSPFLRGCRVR